MLNKTGLCIITSAEKVPTVDNGTAHFEKCKHLLEYKITFYFETSSGQNCNLFLNVAHFLTRVIIRHLWQLDSVVFMHRCLMCDVLLLKV